MWFISDAQYYGVAQQRRRLWIVGSFGNTSAIEVLSKQEGSGRNDTAVKERGERGLCLLTRNGQRNNPDETLIAYTVGTTDFTGDIETRSRNIVASTLRANDHDTTTTGAKPNNIVAHTINTGQRGVAGRIWEDTYIAEADPAGKR